MGDFNEDIKKTNINTFSTHYKLKSLNKELTFYKNFANPVCDNFYF